MDELQQQAFEAFCLGLNGKQIGQIVKRSEQTISDWRKKFNWEKKKQERAVSRDNAEKTTWELLNWNLRILRLISIKNEELLNDKEDHTIQELQAMLTPRGDCDAVQKLHSTIKAKTSTWGDCISISMEMLEYFEQNHYEASKQFAPLMDEWLSHKRKEL